MRDEQKEDSSALPVPPFSNIDLAAGKIDVDTFYPPYLHLQNEIQFSYLRVEPLLDQSIDILERALRIRSDYDSLAAKLFEAKFDVNNMCRELSVQQNEVDTHFNWLKASESNSEVLAQQKLVNGYVSGRDVNKALIDFINAQAERVGYAAYAEAGATRLPWKQNDYGDGSGTTGVPWPNRDPPFAPVLQVAEEAAEYQANYESGLEWRKIQAAQEVDNAVLDQAQERLGTPGQPPNDFKNATGMYARLFWDELYAQFREQRRQAMIAQRDEKQNAIKQDNGALNFGSAMVQLVARYTRDLNDALGRISQAAIGLEKLYGYVDPTCKAQGAKLPPLDPGPRFDNLLIWLRDAASWVIRLTQTDQQVALPLSLRLILKDWDEFISGKAVQLLLDPLPGLPTAASHVRLRGLSIFSVPSDNFSQPLQLLITPPLNSHCIHLDGTRFELDQTQLHACYAGRVLPRSMPQSADVLGADSLYNASPLGVWRIQLLSTAKIAKGLEDIYLDLLLKLQMPTVGKAAVERLA